ncbi:flagellar hook protein FlgE [uncultured Paludibaculum sp.]|uniref:flagellar hook protein FlgE n=1 Tax=uncultured Paludibaculum sp. TaxID=1765020 RepID=UPI002AAB8D65|nr:flagellar hook protein FlgE [uncultured Paludibaculum sp.]
MLNMFNTALTALNANSTAIDVTGHNLANLNTSGYKAGTVSFEELVTQDLSVDSSDINGNGIGAPVLSRQFTNGTVQVTGGLLDAAISGNGFFTVQGSDGNTYYTRAGNFKLDDSGNLVTATGENVQGWMATNGVASPGGVPTNISIPPGSANAPVPSTFFGMNMNLNALGTVDGTNGTFTAPVEVVDSLGTKHTLTATFTKTDTNAWKYDISIDGGDVDGGTAGTPSSLATGTLTFDTNGKLTAPAADAGSVEISLPAFANGAGEQTVNWQLYDSAGASQVTQYGEASAVNSNSGDGSTAAQLTQVVMGDGGKVMAKYSNGTQKLVAVVALASIQNPDSLVAVGNNNYSTTPASGPVSYGEAGTGTRGGITANALESSNVDMARELTNIIIYQRSYQANARVITAGDEISQEILSLKR